MNFGCVELELAAQLDTTSSICSTRPDVELDWLDTFNMTSATGVTSNLVCCVICVKL